MSSLKVLSIVPAFVLAACGSSSTQAPIDGGTSSDGGADTLDGRILFRGLGEGIAFNVEMYRAPFAAPAPIVRGDGHCDIHPSGVDDGFVAPLPPGDLDLGASVTATNASTNVTASVDTSGGDFQYVGTQAGVDAFAKTWTLTNSGSATGLAATTLATVQVPSRVVPIVPAPQGGMVDTTSGHVTLQWTGGAGAQTFHVNLHASNAEVDCYPAPAATSFDLPANVMKVLDPMVTPIIWAESINVVQLGTRRVWIRVTSDNLD